MFLVLPSAAGPSVVEVFVGTSKPGSLLEVDFCNIGRVSVSLVCCHYIKPVIHEIKMLNQTVVEIFVVGCPSLMFDATLMEHKSLMSFPRVLLKTSRSSSIYEKLTWYGMCQSSPWQLFGTIRSKFSGAQTLEQMTYPEPLPIKGALQSAATLLSVDPCAL